MIFPIKIRHNSPKTLATIALLGTVSLFGCTQTQPPVAKVESSPSTAATSQNAPAIQSETPTLKNLQSAYNGESNAHVMYSAFAEKAAKEGYQEVANLFRATSRAEQIHRDNHARAIEAMGATPKNTITTPEVKTTAENLATALKGESYERDTMYPKFISEAKAENNQKAVQTLQYANNAEAQHAQFYTDAKNNLNAWRNKTHSFYVCTQEY